MERIVAVVSLLGVSCAGTAADSAEEPGTNPVLVDDAPRQILGDVDGMYLGTNTYSHYKLRAWLGPASHKVLFRPDGAPVAQKASLISLRRPSVVAGVQGDQVRVVHDRDGLRLYLWIARDQFHEVLLRPWTFRPSEVDPKVESDIYVKLSPGYRVHVTDSGVVADSAEDFAAAALPSDIDHSVIFGGRKRMDKQSPGITIDVSWSPVYAAPRKTAHKLGTFDANTVAIALGKAVNGAYKVHYLSQTADVVGYVFGSEARGSFGGFGTAQAGRSREIVHTLIPSRTCLWHQGRPVGVFYQQAERVLSEPDGDKRYIAEPDPLAQFKVYLRRRGDGWRTCDEGA